ncbi:MAG: BPSS1780 family membrane protein [Amphritea sp.]
MDDQYKVVFTGMLNAGIEHGEFAEQFAERFGCSHEKALQLITSEKEVVVKKGVGKEQANKYHRVLSKMGMDVRVESEVLSEPTPSAEQKPALSVSGQSSDAMESVAPQAVTSETAASDSTAVPCPKCNSERVLNDNCLGCGIVISKYLERNESLQSEDVTNGSLHQEANPYQAPEANLAQEVEEGELTGPASVPASHGWRWLSQAFGHFKQNPIAWILAIVVWTVISVVLNFIPIVGSFAVTLLYPVLTAGYMLGCREQEHGGDFKLSHLFSGFSQNLGQLLLVGLLYLVGIVVMMIIMGFFVAGGMAFFQDAQSMMGPEVMSAAILPALIGILLIFPVMMAYWFAPALVVLNGMSAIAAMKMSFMGCLKNVMPFLVYGLLLMLLMVIGTLPVGLGLLIVLPMMVASIYTSYRDIFYS